MLLKGAKRWSLTTARATSANRKTICFVAGRDGYNRFSFMRRIHFTNQLLLPKIPNLTKYRRMSSVTVLAGTRSRAQAGRVDRRSAANCYFRPLTSHGSIIPKASGRACLDVAALGEGRGGVPKSGLDREDDRSSSVAETVFLRVVCRSVSRHNRRVAGSQPLRRSSAGPATAGQ